MRQGNNLSLVIFLFIVIAFAETLKAEWSAAEIPKAEFGRVSMDTIEELAKEQITGQKETN